MAIFKRSHLFQTITLGIHVSFRGLVDVGSTFLLSAHVSQKRVLVLTGRNPAFPIGSYIWDITPEKSKHVCMVVLFQGNPPWENGTTRL